MLLFLTQAPNPVGVLSSHSLCHPASVWKMVQSVSHLQTLTLFHTGVPKPRSHMTDKQTAYSAISY
jgi:hypothetical protein